MLLELSLEQCFCFLTSLVLLIERWTLLLVADVLFNHLLFFLILTGVIVAISIDATDRIDDEWAIAPFNINAAAVDTLLSVLTIPRQATGPGGAIVINTNTGTIRRIVFGITAVVWIIDADLTFRTNSTQDATTGLGLTVFLDADADAISACLGITIIVWVVYTDHILRAH